MQSSDYIAICAGIVALASFFVAVNQANLARRHNRLSVRPLLTIYRREFNNQPIEYILENRGLGPAIVNELSVWVDNKQIESPDGNPMYTALDRLNIPRAGVGGHLVSEGEAIRANQEIRLLVIPHANDDAVAFEALIDKLPRLKFKVIYASIYEESLEYCGNG